jgi:hypothetical protein
VFTNLPISSKNCDFRDKLLPMTNKTTQELKYGDPVRCFLLGKPAIVPGTYIAPAADSDDLHIVQFENQFPDAPGITLLPLFDHQILRINVQVVRVKEVLGANHLGPHLYFRKLEYERIDVNDVLLWNEPSPGQVFKEIPKMGIVWNIVDTVNVPDITVPHFRGYNYTQKIELNGDYYNDCC